MSWRAQNRYKDAKTLNVGPAIRQYVRVDGQSSDMKKHINSPQGYPGGCNGPARQRSNTPEPRSRGDARSPRAQRIWCPGPATRPTSAGGEGVNSVSHTANAGLVGEGSVLVCLAADRPDQDRAGATSLPAAPPVGSDSTHTIITSSTSSNISERAPLEDVFHPPAVILRTMSHEADFGNGIAVLQSKRKGSKPALCVWRGRGWEAEAITIHDNG
jgi:hypothetical protein